MKTLPLLPIFAVLLLFSLPGTLTAQVGDGGGGLPDGGGIPDVTPPPVTGDGFDTGDGAGTGTGGTTESDGQIESVEPIRLEFEIDELRNQGFVGPTAETIQNRGFVGPPSEATELPLGEDRSIGGGVNEGIGNRGATTSSAQIQENGFTVQRRGLRSRLRPAFAAPTMPGFVTQSRFQSRIARQPVVRTMGQGISITVSNRTAIMTGSVSSEAERQIIKRQLRLEPGVYSIDDRTSLTR